MIDWSVVGQVAFSLMSEALPPVLAAVIVMVAILYIYFSFKRISR